MKKLIAWIVFWLTERDRLLDRIWELEKINSQLQGKLAFLKSRLMDEV